MRIARVLALLTVVAILPPALVAAQGLGIGAGAGAGAGMALPVFGGALGGYWGYGGGHASTIAEGYQRGMADVVRSAGAANLMDSEAAKNFEDARSQYLDNVLKSTQTFFEQRKMAKAYRQEERGPPLSREAMYRMARDAAPKRLSAGDYDPVTGELSFPLVLQDAPFDDLRNQLQDLFKTRNETGGGLSLQTYLSIDATAREMQQLLESRIRDYPPSAYLQAREFLRSLSHEARFAAG